MTYVKLTDKLRLPPPQYKTHLRYNLFQSKLTSALFNFNRRGEIKGEIESGGRTLRFQDPTFKVSDVSKADKSGIAGRLGGYPCFSDQTV